MDRTTTRRRFLQQGAAALGVLIAAPARAAEPTTSGRPLRAAVIGHTGGGDYGHGYDRIFSGLEDAVVTAVADPDPEGGRAAAARAGAPRSYTDHREMLEKERPELVSIAFRHPVRHREVALAAIEAGASLLLEKPMTATVADADAILEAAARRGAKILVAHNRRYTAEWVKVKRLLDEGLIGAVREMRIQGKQDSRAGGEDLIVLGTHDFDFLRLCFGDPRWCSAAVLQDGREVTRRDVRLGKEPIRVAGDTIRAQFAFPGNVHVTWSSVTAPGGWNAPKGPRERWAFEILGTKGIIGYQSGIGFGWLESPDFLQPGDGARWKPLPDPRLLDWPEHRRHMGRDLIQAVRTNGEPAVTGRDGRWAIEMVAAVYQSHFHGARVTFPLTDRTDPLAP